MPPQGHPQHGDGEGVPLRGVLPLCDHRRVRRTVLSVDDGPALRAVASALRPAAVELVPGREVPVDGARASATAGSAPDEPVLSGPVG